MSKATIGGELVTVDADGFPETYELDNLPADVAAAQPQTEDVVSDKATEAAPAAGTAPETNGTPKAGKGKKAMKVPGPTNTPKTNPKAGKGRGGAKGNRTQASVTGKFGPAEPKGTVQDLPVKELVRDRRLQMRAATEDKATVEKYKQLYQDNPDTLPAIKVVQIPESERESLDLPSRYVVWDGFQRCEAREQAGLKSIPAEVAPGTWALAVRLSLTANATHGLPRSFADLRRALSRILDDDDLKAEVIAEGNGKGGTTVAFARAIGASIGFVHKALNDMGLMVRGDKIVKRPQKNEPATAPAPAPEYAAHGERSESQEAIKSSATAALIHVMLYAAAALQRRYLELLTRDDAKTLLKEIASKYGIPITEGARGDDPDAPPVEYWPGVDSVLLTLEELKEAHQKMNMGQTPA